MQDIILPQNDINTWLGRSCLRIFSQSVWTVDVLYVIMYYMHLWFCQSPMYFTLWDSLCKLLSKLTNLFNNTFPIDTANWPKSKLVLIWSLSCVIKKCYKLRNHWWNTDERTSYLLLNKRSWLIKRKTDHNTQVWVSLSIGQGSSIYHAAITQSHHTNMAEMNRYTLNITIISMSLF